MPIIHSFIDHLNAVNFDSRGAFNDMNSGIGADGLAQFAHFEVKSGVLERLLHLTSTERPEVAAVFGAGAIRILGGQFGEFGFSGHDFLSESVEELQGLVLGAGDFLLSPGGRPSAAFVFDQQMTGLNLLIGSLLGRLRGLFPLGLLRVQVHVVGLT